MDIIVSDFDNTLFKRNLGLLVPQVKYLEERGLPVYIVTYRAADQKDFILGTLQETSIDIIGVAFAGSRKKDPSIKFYLIDEITKKYHVVEALDDDVDVVVGYRSRGIKTILV